MAKDKVLPATNRFKYQPTPLKDITEAFKSALGFFLAIFKTSMWKDYVFGYMSHSTHVISLSPQAKGYVLILFKHLIPLTFLKTSTFFLDSDFFPPRGLPLIF